METWDICIVGAGAAGLMCAIEAGRRGRRVLVLDHNRKPAEKIRISGGGRCNFTNLDIRPERFLSRNPHFAKSALSRYTQWDFIDMLGRHGVTFHEKTLGQLFCDTSAKAIIAMLLAELAEVGAELRLETAVTGVERRPGGGFALSTTGGGMDCTSLVVATGGKSIPKMGATGWGYEIARQFDLLLVETRPGLVPLTFGDRELAATRPLAGVSVEARVACNGAVFDEGLLFTHRGLSGPSILQISSYWHPGDGVEVDLAAGVDVLAHLRAMRGEKGRQTVARALGTVLPRRLAEDIATAAGITGNLADQPDTVLEQLARRVNRWAVMPSGSEGYRTAEVTLGGVDTDALNARTMEARAVPGLYFIGEVVDVTGWLGGYNFQWAWSSGWAAGQVA